jgi:hypothetical protein
MFWENSPAHQGEAKKSLARSMAIIKMAPDITPDQWDHTDENKYGLGDGERDTHPCSLLSHMYMMYNIVSYHLSPCSAYGGAVLQTLPHRHEE